MDSAISLIAERKQKLSIEERKEDEIVEGIDDKKYDITFICLNMDIITKFAIVNSKLNENEYLYMVNGGVALDNEYTAGQFLIEIFGYKNITQGSGITSVYKSWIEHQEDKIKTNIYIDLKDLESESSLSDIIGNDGASNCHFGQINYSQTGIIYKSVITCIETPAGTGEVDIDVYQSTASNGTEGALVTSLAGATQLVDTNTDWTVDTSKIFTTNPSDSNYLYLAILLSELLI